MEDSIARANLLKLILDQPFSRFLQWNVPIACLLKTSRNCIARQHCFRNWWCMRIKWNSNQNLSYAINISNPPPPINRKKPSVSLLSTSCRRHHHPQRVLIFCPRHLTLFFRFPRKARAFIKWRPHPKHEAAQTVPRQYDTYKTTMSFFTLNVLPYVPDHALINRII